MIRSDLKLTTETGDDGASLSCLSRGAENAWERVAVGDTVKRCYGASEVTDLYLFDAKAKIAEDERCQERTAKNDTEREVFGHTVKVCNQHAVPGGYSGDDDGSRDHVNTHRPRIERISLARNKYGDYDHTVYCTSAQLTQTSRRFGRNVDMAITIRWCHDNGSRVDEVQTVYTVPESYTDAFVGSSHQFCEWVHHESKPDDVLWRYFHADGGGYAYLEYGSAVEARYGNKRNTEFVDFFIYIPQRWVKIPFPVTIRACSEGFFNNRAAVVGENDGGSRPWR